MQIISKILCTLLAVCMVSCCCDCGSDVGADVVMTEHTYKHIEGDTTGTDLKIYHLATAAAGEGEAKPAFILIHGGGWTGGTYELFKNQCEYFATQGMVCFSIQYRLNNRDYDGVKGTIVHCLEDAKSAIRWVRANAEQFNIDPDRIVVGGGSAGGCLAAAASMSPLINDANDDLAISSGADALILYNPVAHNGPAVGDIKPYNYGGVDAACKAAGFEDYSAFSPMANIREGVPPTLFLVGQLDHFLPLATCVEYQRLVESVGGECDLRVYANQAHGFFNMASNGSGFAATTRDVHDFLRKKGYVKGSSRQVDKWMKQCRAENAYADIDTFVYDRSKGGIAEKLRDWCEANNRVDNYLLNGDFKSGFDFWRGAKDNSVESGWYRRYQNVAVEQGAVYEYGFTALKGGENAPRVYMEIRKNQGNAKSKHGNGLTFTGGNDLMQSGRVKIPNGTIKVDVVLISEDESVCYGDVYLRRVR